MKQSELNPKDWTEDISHENGNYQCHCIRCNDYFTGHKRRRVCKVCASTTPPVEANTAEEILHQTFEKYNNDPNSKLGIIEIEVEAMEAYHAQFTPSAKSVEVEEADEQIFDQPFIDEAIKLYPVTKDSLAGPIENETEMYKAKAKQLVFTKGAEFGANWQEQKQADTISRMREALEESQKLLMDLIALNYVPDEICPAMNDVIDKIYHTLKEKE